MSAIAWNAVRDGNGITVRHQWNAQLTEKSFLAMCRQDGVKAALGAFKHTEHARKVHAFWRSHQAAWWNAEELWQQACDALRETHMFPPEAFEPPDSQVKQPHKKRRRVR